MRTKAELRAEIGLLRGALVDVAHTKGRYATDGYSEKFDVCWCGALGGLAHPCTSSVCANARRILELGND